MTAVLPLSGVVLPPDLCTAFADSIRDGELCAMSQLLSKDPTLHITPDCNGFSALHTAANYNQIEACKLLLEFGASVNTRTFDGSTALTIACYRSNAALVQLLLQAGAQVNPSCQFASALHEAAAAGAAECCQLLIDHGCSLSSSDCHYGTPLHSACFFNRVQTAEVLLRAGANVNATMNHRTPLHHAVSCGSVGSFNRELIYLLLAFGARTSAKDNSGQTPADILALKRVSQQHYGTWASTIALLRWLEVNPLSLQCIARKSMLRCRYLDYTELIQELPTKLKLFVQCSNAVS